MNLKTMATVTRIEGKQTEEGERWIYDFALGSSAGLPGQEVREKFAAMSPEEAHEALAAGRLKADCPWGPHWHSLSWVECEARLKPFALTDPFAVPVVQIRFHCEQPYTLGEAIDLKLYDTKQEVLPLPETIAH